MVDWWSLCGWLGGGKGCAVGMVSLSGCRIVTLILKLLLFVAKHIYQASKLNYNDYSLIEEHYMF